MHSAIYRGWTRHRRSTPAEHEFTYDIFMAYLDLDELAHVFDGRWLWSVGRRNVAAFHREDQMGDAAVPLSTTIRDLVEQQSGRRPEGPIRLLTHLRYFGHCFNPVSFYYCFDAAGERVETVVADVSNTPWRERHPYVLGPALDEGSGVAHRYRFKKLFHVSPFHDMDSDYDWRFTDPAERLTVHMECSRGAEMFMDATLSMERRELTGGEMARALARHPLMTGKVVWGIHWQALRLWLKKCPVYDHPRKRAAQGGAQ